MKEVAALAVAFLVLAGTAWGVIEFLSYLTDLFRAWCARTFEDDDSY